MTEAQRAAIAAIESQQPQKHNTVWMAGEQLKEIARSEPGSAELLAKDLAGKGMTIADAEKKTGRPSGRRCRRRLRRSLSTGPHGRRRTNSAGSSACSRGRA